MRRAFSVLLVTITLLVGCTTPSPRRDDGVAISPPVTASAPPTSPDTQEVVRFAAVGDVGDGSRNEADVAAAIAKAHAAEPIDLLLLLGDLIYPDGDPAEYEEKFARPYRAVLDAGIEIRAVLGNHDAQTDPEGVARAFGMPSRYYAFAGGLAQFFAIDSSAGVISRKQRTWLEQDLAGSAAAWKIAFMHHPMYSSGVRGPVLNVRAALEDLFVQHGVQLVLTGHDHDYERTKPIRGLVHIVAGGGCCPRPGPLKSNAFTASFKTGLSFVIVDVYPFQLRLRALDVEGNILDSSAIEAKAAEEAA